jgi:hypothetical protein
MLEGEHKLLKAGDFIAKLTQHIPPKHKHLTRYYGMYSSRIQGEAAKDDSLAISLLACICNIDIRLISNHKLATEINIFRIFFIFPNSILRDGKVVPIFKPPFDIIWKMAKQARKSNLINQKQAANEPAACPIALPNLQHRQNFYAYILLKTINFPHQKC